MSVPVEDVVGKLAERHGVRNPSMPGGVLLSGTLPKEAVAEMSPLCKSWLFLNPETDPNLHRDVIEASGVQVRVTLGLQLDSFDSRVMLD